MAGALFFQPLQIVAEAIAALDEQVSHPTRVVQRSRTLVGADIEIDATAREWRVFHERKDRGSGEPERRAEHGCGAEDIGTREERIERDQSTHRRTGDRRVAWLVECAIARID